MDKQNYSNQEPFHLINQEIEAILESPDVNIPTLQKNLERVVGEIQDFGIQADTYNRIKRILQGRCLLSEVAFDQIEGLLKPGEENQVLAILTGIHQKLEKALRLRQPMQRSEYIKSLERELQIKNIDRDLDKKELFEIFTWLEIVARKKTQDLSGQKKIEFEDVILNNQIFPESSSQPLVLDEKINNFLVLGVIGAGKTTLFKFLIQAHFSKNLGNYLGKEFNRIEGVYSQDQKRLPVLITAEDFYEQAEAIGLFDDTSSNPYLLPCLKKITETESFKFDFFIDGLDQITSREERRKILRVIDQISKNPNLRFIVASRFTTETEDEHLNKNFLYTKIEGISENEKSKFVKNYLFGTTFGSSKKPISEDQIEPLLHVIKNIDSPVSALTRTAGLLVNICMAFKTELACLKNPNDINQINKFIQNWTISKVFKEAVKHIVDSREQPILKDRVNILNQIAYEVFLKKGVLGADLSKDDLTQTIRKLELDNPEGVLEAMLALNLILEKSDGSFEFVHNLYEAYFLAEYLFSLGDKAKEDIFKVRAEKDYFYNSDFQQVLKFYVSMLDAEAGRLFLNQIAFIGNIPSVDSAQGGNFLDSLDKRGLIAAINLKKYSLLKNDSDFLVKDFKELLFSQDLEEDFKVRILKSAILHLREEAYPLIDCFLNQENHDKAKMSVLKYYIYICQKGSIPRVQTFLNDPNQNNTEIKIKIIKSALRYVGEDALTLLTEFIGEIQEKDKKNRLMKYALRQLGSEAFTLIDKFQEESEQVKIIQYALMDFKSNALDLVRKFLNSTKNNPDNPHGIRVIECAIKYLPYADIPNLLETELVKFKNNQSVINVLKTLIRYKKEESLLFVKDILSKLEISDEIKTRVIVFVLYLLPEVASDLVKFFFKFAKDKTSILDVIKSAFKYLDTNAFELILSFYSVSPSEHKDEILSDMINYAASNIEKKILPVLERSNKNYAKKGLSSKIIHYRCAELRNAITSEEKFNLLTASLDDMNKVVFPTLKKLLSQEKENINRQASPSENLCIKNNTGIERVLKNSFKSATNDNIVDKAKVALKIFRMQSFLSVKVLCTDERFSEENRFKIVEYMIKYLELQSESFAFVLDFVRDSKAEEQVRLLQYTVDYLKEDSNKLVLDFLLSTSVLTENKLRILEYVLFEFSNKELAMELVEKYLEFSNDEEDKIQLIKFVLYELKGSNFENLAVKLSEKYFQSEKHNLQSKIRIIQFILYALDDSYKDLIIGFTKNLQNEDKLKILRSVLKHDSTLMTDLFVEMGDQGSVQFKFQVREMLHFYYSKDEFPQYDYIPGVLPENSLFGLLVKDEEYGEELRNWQEDGYYDLTQYNFLHKWNALSNHKEKFEFYLQTKRILEILIGSDAKSGILIKYEGNFVDSSVRKKIVELQEYLCQTFENTTEFLCVQWFFSGEIKKVQSPEYFDKYFYIDFIRGASDLENLSPEERGREEDKSKNLLKEVYSLNKKRFGFDFENEAGKTDNDITLLDSGRNNITVITIKGTSLVVAYYIGGIKDKEFFIDFIASEPLLEGFGLGTKLIEDLLEDKLGKWGCEYIRVDSVNPLGRENHWYFRDLGAESRRILKRNEEIIKDIDYYKEIPQRFSLIITKENFKNAKERLEYYFKNFRRASLEEFNFNQNQYIIVSLENVDDFNAISQEKLSEVKTQITNFETQANLLFNAGYKIVGCKFSQENPKRREGYIFVKEVS